MALMQDRRNADRLRFNDETGKQTWTAEWLLEFDHPGGDESGELKLKVKK